MDSEVVSVAAAVVITAPELLSKSTSALAVKPIKHKVKLLCVPTLKL